MTEQEFWDTLCELKGQFHFLRGRYIRQENTFAKACPVCAVYNYTKKEEQIAEYFTGDYYKAGKELGLTEEFSKNVALAADKHPFYNKQLRNEILECVGLKENEND